MTSRGIRIVLRGQKHLRTLRLLPLFGSLFPPLGGAHLCSVQYELRFGLASAALRST